MESVANVFEGFRLLVGTVGFLGKVIDHALSVAFLLLLPEPPGGDTAYDGVQVVALGLWVVLQQAAAFQITDGFL